MFLLPQLYSCQPNESCPERETKYSQYYISEDDKSKTPFTGTDTLVYISNEGDTAILYGQGKKAFIEEVAQKTSADPGCPHYDYNYFENIEFFYKGSNPELNLIFIDFNASVYSPIQTNADFFVNSRKYSGYLGFINNNANYSDSLKLLDNTIYYGIDAGIFYNCKYGLLRVTTDHDTWLLNVE